MATLLAASAAAPDALFTDLIIILAAAGCIAVAMHRLRLAIIPAYLLAGAIIGPGGLGFVGSPDRVATIADLALILLLFGIGLHMDLAVLRADLWRLIASGVAAMTLCALLLWPLALGLGVSTLGALVIAIALAMSSTAVVLRIIQDRRELHMPDGRLSIAILIMQDLAAIVALLMIPPLARWNSAPGAGAGSQAVGASLGTAQQFLLSGVIAVTGVALIVVVGRFLLPRLLLEAARQRSGEAMMVVSTAAALGAAGLTSAVGLSPALGAFLGGFLLCSTPVRHQLAGQVATIRDLFSAVFFTAIGMSLSVADLMSHLPLILGGAAVILTVKSFATALACWLTGWTGNLSIKVGLTLSQAGEFSIVVLSSALAVSGGSAGLIDKETMGLVLAMIVITLMATPAVLNGAKTLDAKLRPLPALRRFRRGRATAPGIKATPAPSDSGAPASGADPKPRPRRVIIAGYGLVGRVVSDYLSAHGAVVTIIELNPATVKAQARLGRSVVFGDVSNPEVLESAGVHEADALILTIPDEDRVLRACHVARQTNAGIFIVARTSYVSKGMTASTLGANEVIIEELATAEAMERLVARVILFDEPGAPKA